jgi:cation diffusion facilitator family transporter
MSHSHAHHEHEHGHGHAHGHSGHSHGPVDPTIASTADGLRAIRWSFFVLLATALIQVVIVFVSGSVGLLADTIHNFADAATAIPLGIAFWLTRRGAPRHFTYGFGRTEDVAGIAIVLTILASSIVAAYESVSRLLHPRPIAAIGWVAAAAVLGFLGNEGVAIFRIRVGKKIGSAALVADGYHARADGWTSLAVLAGALGVWLGYPIADAVVGLLISLAILILVWQASRSIGLRLLDAVEPATLDAIRQAAAQASRVENVSDVRVRWIGHRLHAEVSVTVPGGLTVADGHSVAREVQHQLLHDVPNLGGVTVHVDPSGEEGESHHGIGEHEHDGLPLHSH